MMENNWRNVFSTSERAAFIQKLIMMLEMCIPNSDKAVLRNAATSFERNSYRQANSKQEYIQNFVQKFEELKARFQSTGAIPNETNAQNTFSQTLSNQASTIIQQQNASNNIPGLLSQVNSQNNLQRPDFIQLNYNSKFDQSSSIGNAPPNPNNHTRAESDLAEAIKNIQSNDSDKKVPNAISSALVMNYLQQQHNLNQNNAGINSNQAFNTGQQLFQKIEQLKNIQALQMLQNQQKAAQQQHLQALQQMQGNSINNIAEADISLNQNPQTLLSQLSTSNSNTVSGIQTQQQAASQPNAANQNFNANTTQAQSREATTKQNKPQVKEPPRKKKPAAKKPAPKKAANVKTSPTNQSRVSNSPASLYSPKGSAKTNNRDVSTSSASGAPGLSNQKPALPLKNSPEKEADTLPLTSSSISIRNDNPIDASSSKPDNKAQPKLDFSNIPMNRVFNINVNNRHVGLSLQQIVQMRLVTQQKGDPNMIEQFSALVKHFLVQAQAQLQLEASFNLETNPSKDKETVRSQSNANDASFTFVETSAANEKQPLTSSNPSVDQIESRALSESSQGASFSQGAQSSTNFKANIPNKQKISPETSFKIQEESISLSELKANNSTLQSTINTPSAVFPGDQNTIGGIGNGDFSATSSILGSRNLKTPIEASIKVQQSPANPVSNIQETKISQLNLTANSAQHLLLDSSSTAKKPQQISASDAYKVISMLELQIQKLHLKKAPITNLSKEEQTKIRQILPVLEVMFAQVQKVLPIVYIWNHDEKAIAKILTMKVMFNDQLESTKNSIESQVTFEKLRKIQPSDLTSQAALEGFQAATQSIISNMRNEFLITYSELDLIRTQLITLINQVKAEASLNSSTNNSASQPLQKQEPQNVQTSSASQTLSSTVPQLPLVESSSSDSPAIPISAQVTDKTSVQTQPPLIKGAQVASNMGNTMSKDVTDSALIRNTTSRKRSLSIDSTRSDVQSISSDSSGDDIPLLKKHALFTKNSSIPASPSTIESLKDASLNSVTTTVTLKKQKTNEVLPSLSQDIPLLSDLQLAKESFLRTDSRSMDVDGPIKGNSQPNPMMFEANPTTQQGAIKAVTTINTNTPQQGLKPITSSSLANAKEAMLTLGSSVNKQLTQNLPLAIHSLPPSQPVGRDSATSTSQNFTPSDSAKFSSTQLPEFTDIHYQDYWQENKCKHPLLYLKQSKKKLDSSRNLENVDTESYLLNFTSDIKSPDSFSIYNSIDMQFPTALFNDFF